ncbi:PucR family transcriptional regulator [Nocardia jejuensis]|uniref:PucR family transcriptional regulator n=1 Tax=Nocardia jejuensis TaxID=328049 RepID=UPI000834BBC8|nr:helix-turn-helix domain-containing protein [Nocardia jejuensis]
MEMATPRFMVEDLNSDVARLLSENRSPHHPVTSVELFDAADPELPPGAMVLAVGVSGEEQVRALLSIAERDSAAAVVIKGSAAKIAADIAREVAVVWLREDMSWMELAVSLRRRLIGKVSADRSSDGSAANELFALADSISAVVGGPVTIESDSAEVLAWSTGQEGADPLRVESILARTVRPGWVHLLAEEGVLSEIGRSRDPVFVPAHSVDGQPMPRVAIAVRGGAAVLGYIWIVVREPLSPETAARLRDIARVVAPQLAQLNLDPPSAARKRQRQLADAVFAGGPAATVAAGQLGLVPGPLVLIAIGADSPAHQDGSDITAQRRLDSLMEHYLSAVHPSSVVARNAGVLHALLAWPGLTEQAAMAGTRSLAEDFAGRSLDRTVYRLAVSPAVASVTYLSVARVQANAILATMLRDGVSGTGQVSAELADVALPMLLGRLADYADSLELPDFVGPLRALADDEGTNRQLLESLSAYFQAGAVLDDAAASLHVHVNTLRYRMKKVQELSGLDLRDADAMLLSQLELRRWQLRRGTRTPAAPQP